MNDQPTSPSARRLLSLVAAAIVACCFLLLAHYAGKATVVPRILPGLAARARDLGVLALFLASAGLAGVELRERAKLELSTPAYRLVVSFALGFLWLYMAGMLLAIAQLVYAPMLWAVPLLTLALCRRRYAAFIADVAACVPSSVQLGPISVLSGLLGLAYAFVTLAPPHDIDAMAYHLAIPAEYLAHGGATRVADNFYKNFPPAMSMLYLFLMGMGSDFLPKILHGFFLLLLVLLCFDRFRALGDKTVAAYATLLFAAQWSVHHAIDRANVDLHFALYALCSFFVLLELALEVPGNALAAVRLALAGTLVGGAIASKLNALSSVVASEVVLAVLVFTKRASWRAVLGFHVAAFLVYSPALARNALYSLEPAFVPFAELLSPILPMDPEEVARYRAASEMKPLLMMRLTPITFLLTPLFTYVDGRFPNPTFDGFIDPLYLVFLVVGAVLCVRNVALRWIYAYMFGFYCAWLATATVIRYAFPVLPLLAFVTVRGLASLAEASSEALRKPLALAGRGVVLVFVLLSTTDFVMQRGTQLALNVPAFFEAVDRVQYMRSIGATELSIVEVGAFLQQRSGERASAQGEGVYMVFESQSMFLGARFYNDPAYVNLRLLEARMQKGEDPIQGLVKRGYRYVLTDFQRVPWLRNAANKNPHMSPYPEGLRMLDGMLAFWKRALLPRLTHLRKFGTFDLFEIGAHPSARGASAAQ